MNIVVMFFVMKNIVMLSVIKILNT